MPDEGVYLGRATWRGGRRPFKILQPDRRAHMYVIGKTGTGKSSLLEAMVRQDLIAGRGLALFDPHGDLYERIVAWTPAFRRDDLILLDVPDPELAHRFNPLAQVPPLRRSLAANGIVETFKKLFADSWGYRLEYIFRISLLLLLDQPQATISDVLRLFRDEEFRNEAVQRATNAQVRRFWTEEFHGYGKGFRAEALAPIENKVGTFLADPFVSKILSSPTSTFEPRQVIDTNKVLLVNLSKGKIGEAPAALFGGLLVSALGLAGLSRADNPEARQRDFALYLDEFQSMTTLALADQLAELRKYGLQLVLASQYLEGIDPAVRAAILGNVGTLITFRVGATDAAKLVKEIGEPATVDDLTLLPNRMFWIKPLVRGHAWPAFTGEMIDLR